MKLILSIFTSTRTMFFLLVIFTVSIATATFIENDFGNDVARKLIYNAKWFELLLLLGMVNIIAVILKRKLYKRNKLSLFLFHIAFVIIILGAGVTRYFGDEGMIHIREGHTTRTWITTGTYLQVMVEKEGKSKYKNFPVLFTEVSKNRFQKKLNYDNDEIKIQTKEFISKAEKDIEYIPDGEPYLHIVTIQRGGRNDQFITEGETVSAGKISMYFSSSVRETISSDSVILADKNGSLTFIAPFPVIRSSMKEGLTDTLAAYRIHAFNPFLLHYFDGKPFVLQNYIPSAQITARPSLQPDKNLPSAVKLEIEVDGRRDIIYAWGQKELIRDFNFRNYNNIRIGVRYGAIQKLLPFNLRLNDFIIKRYPGSESPSWFESNVQVLDAENGIDREERIFMNHILKYKGYRFYQSSYDMDEKGTVLSLNRDVWGTTITYLGYLLLALGMLFSLLNRKSRFQKLAVKSTAVKQTLVILVPLFLLSSNITAQLEPETLPVIDKAHAREFGEVLVQDNGGRIEPINTLTSEVLRKVSRKEKYKDQTPDQVFLGMIVYSELWQKELMIKVGHPEIQKLLGIETKFASFLDFFPQESEGSYLIRSYVEEAYRKKPAYRNKFDSEIIRLDERVNICYLVYNGALLKIFPDPKDSLNKWHSYASASSVFRGEDSLFTQQIFKYYIEEIRKSVRNGDWKNPSEIVKALKIFQSKYGVNVIPSDTRLRAEAFYNKANIFSRIIRFYLFIGFVLLLFQFIHIFLPRFRIKYISIPAIVLIGIVFIIHSFGLGLRWYVAGHAPWSNGYEALVFIAWGTLLAGLLFAHKSKITISATAILAALILQTAHLGFMDPQITNLVPVLKSYWLIIHVAVITASYGFLGLGALVAFVNLLLLFFESEKNRDRLEYQINKLSGIIEMTLIVGLYLLSIGTFLGGVWANESWGRYWAWDPKETWALVTVIVYAIILHLHLVPGLKGRMLFNIVSLIGFGAVVMTYFGVNYYLSGLHSYAQGDEIPIPPTVYYSVAVIVVLSAMVAYNQYRLKKLERLKK